MGCRASRRRFLWSASSSRLNSPCDAHGTSTENILLILEGEAEATVGDEQGRVSAEDGGRPGNGAARPAQRGRRNGPGRSPSTEWNRTTSAIQATPMQTT